MDLPNQRWRRENIKARRSIQWKIYQNFLVETLDRLKVVLEATAGCWDAAKRFRELQECLRGDALKSYKKLVKNNYSNPANKINANYEEIVRLIPTDLGDHPYPGNRVRHYMMNKVHFVNYRCLDGRRYKPTDVLCRMCQLRGYLWGQT